MRVLHRGIKSGQKYSEKIRHFCLALVYFSPRAYEHIRKTFNNHLPNIKTIRNWFANSDIKSDPGLQPDHLDRLKKIAKDYEAKHKKKVICSLVFDEIHIRQQVFWSLHQLDFCGFVNYGQDSSKKENVVAKAAIVFILKGIETNFEYPVAYHFIHELKAAERKTLVIDIVSAVTKCDIKISNLTFDGLAANATMCKLLTANLNVFHNDVKTFILNPITNERIFIILDPCHMLKLTRNVLASKKIFFVGKKGRKVEWRFIESLYEFSKNQSLRAHKLTRKHIQWDRNPMNVRLAAQTFSDSVADNLQFLMEQNVPEFQGAEATIDFIRKMNKLFDIFNSRHSNHTNIFKTILSVNNKRIVFDFLAEMIKYIKSLHIEVEYFEEKNSKSASKKIKKVQILKTRSHCGFRGFIIDSISLMEMFQEYIEQNHLLTSISTYNLLQDVIEMFFGRIRACNGFNNNPNVHQFRGAYRKVQANMKLDLSIDSNCRAFDYDLPDNMYYSNIYFVTSKRPKIGMNQSIYDEQKEGILDELERSEKNANELRQLESTNDIDAMGGFYHMLDATSNFMVAYIASSIERKIMESNTFHCNDCVSVFEENEKDDSINTMLLRWKPCTSTIVICKASEKFFKLFDVEKPNRQFDFKVLFCLIFRYMDLNSLFSMSKFDCDINHKYQFIKCIVGQYVTIRANQISKQITLERHDKLVRQRLNRLTNIKGQ